jgi:hypothetical protein
MTLLLVALVQDDRGPPESSAVGTAQVHMPSGAHPDRAVGAQPPPRASPPNQRLLAVLGANPTTLARRAGAEAADASRGDSPS